MSVTAPAGTQRSATRRLTAPTGAAAAAAVAVVLGGCLAVAFEARHSTFSGDDWTFVLHRRGFSAGVFLDPHNEHLSALPVAAYKILLAVFGAGSYTPFIALLLILHATACGLLYLIARRYVGPWGALVPTCVLVVLGPAWQDLLWAFQIGYVGSVAAGLGMLLCLERDDRRGDVWAGTLLGVSLLCSSIGLGMVVLATLRIVAVPRRRWQRLWAVAIPVALYLLWYGFYGVSTIRASNIPHIPRYVFAALSAALSSVTGLAHTSVSPYLVSVSFGHVLAVALLVVAVLAFLRGARPTAMPLAAAVAALALWVAEALEYFPNGREAAQSRYQYTAATLVLLVGVGWLAGRRWPRWGRLVLVVLTVAVCASNLDMLHQRTGPWSQDSAYDRAEIGALEISRGLVAPGFAPENIFTTAVTGNHNLGVVTAGPYFSATHSFGSPADRPAQILTEPEGARRAADLVLAEAERLRPQPLAVAARSGSLGGASCRPVLGGTLESSTGSGAVIVRAPAEGGAVLAVRRFAEAYLVRWPVAAGRGVVLRLPVDHSAVPWRPRITGPAGTVVCLAGRGVAVAG